jgi:hypothetical protein
MRTATKRDSPPSRRTDTENAVAKRVYGLGELLRRSHGTREEFANARALLLFEQGEHVADDPSPNSTDGPEEPGPEPRAVAHVRVEARASRCDTRPIAIADEMAGSSAL